MGNVSHQTPQEKPTNDHANRGGTVHSSKKKSNKPKMNQGMRIERLCETKYCSMLCSRRDEDKWELGGFLGSRRGRQHHRGAGRMDFKRNWRRRKEAIKRCSIIINHDQTFKNKNRFNILSLLFIGPATYLLSNYLVLISIYRNPNNSP